VPYQGYSDGLYLVAQKSEAKRVDHYGILDIGNRICLPGADGINPVIIHQTPPTIRIDWFQNTGVWRVLGAVADEPFALQRLNAAFTNPNYDLFGNNCEHFARFVALGTRESTQVQAAVVVAGLAALTFVVVQGQRS
jgi:hypothetical protein